MGYEASGGEIFFPRPQTRRRRNREPAVLACGKDRLFMGQRPVFIFCKRLAPALFLAASIQATRSKAEVDDLPWSRRGFPIFRAERCWTICGSSRRAPIKTIGEQFDNMAVLIGGRRFWLWRAVDDEGGEASDGRHFEILLNLTFRPRPHPGATFKERRIWWP